MQLNIENEESSKESISNEINTKQNNLDESFVIRDEEPYSSRKKEDKKTASDNYYYIYLDII